MAVRLFAHTITVWGVAKTAAEARAFADRRLRNACDDILAGRIPVDEGTHYQATEPGGGGGPQCEAFAVVKVEWPIDSLLPENPAAVPRPSDD